MECQAEQRQKAGDTWKEQNFVFTTKLGTFNEPSSLDLKFRQVLHKAGLPPMRFHHLRHSAATILLRMGVRPKQVQELLGSPLSYEANE